MQRPLDYLYGSADLAAEHLREKQRHGSLSAARCWSLAPELAGSDPVGETSQYGRRGRWLVSRSNSRWPGGTPPAAVVAVAPLATGVHRRAVVIRRPGRDGALHSLRSVTKALRKFEAEPHTLAVALRDELGESG